MTDPYVCHFCSNIYHQYTPNVSIYTIYTNIYGSVMGIISWSPSSKWIPTHSTYNWDMGVSWKRGTPLNHQSSWDFPNHTIQLWGYPHFQEPSKWEPENVSHSHGIWGSFPALTASHSRSLRVAEVNVVEPWPGKCWVMLIFFSMRYTWKNVRMETTTPQVWCCWFRSPPIGSYHHNKPNS